MVRMLFLVTALSISGCMHGAFHCDKPAPEQFAKSDPLPCECKANVYVFLINGFDPFCLQDTLGLRDHLNMLGFGKTYYGQMHHVHWFAGEIRKLRLAKPEARIVICGTGWGAMVAKHLAYRMADEGVDIDLVAYLEPNGIAADRPHEHIRKTLVIRHQSTHNNTPDEAGANETVSIPGYCFTGIATHPETLDRMGNALVELAAEVPLLAVADQPLPSLLDDPIPTPRPVSGDRWKAMPGPWEFLLPQDERRFHIMP